MRAFYGIAWMGLVSSVLVHIVSIAGPEDVLSDLDAFVWLLHAGVIILAFPLVRCSSRLKATTESRDFWRSVLRYSLAWMKNMLALFVVYGIVNFIWFMANAPQGHGGGTPPSVFRGFSGHWMIFYSLEVAVFCSYLRRRSVQDNQS